MFTYLQHLNTSNYLDSSQEFAPKLTRLLPNVTVVEFTVHYQTRLKSKFKGTVDSCLFLTVKRGANLCSLFQNVQGTYKYHIWKNTQLSVQELTLQK